MINSIKEIISEQKSPLFRIMWVTDIHDQAHRQFDNNISAFHIGGGYILSVAHNLRTEVPFLKSIPENVFHDQIFSELNPNQKLLFSKSYNKITESGVYHINTTNASQVKAIAEVFQTIGFDKRWCTLGEKGISVPHLIIQFCQDSFYGYKSITSEFKPNNYFFEPSLNRHTFLLKLELQYVSYENDIAIYKITGCPDEVISKIPFVRPDFSLADHETNMLYCLQSSPAGYLGRLLNKANIEGYLDQYQIFTDRVGGNYVLEGLRYLIKGYFRFGSSGAPYLLYDHKTESFKVNAIQSEASPIQLSINHNREGNFQYVNAIATPLNNIESEIMKLL